MREMDPMLHLWKIYIEANDDPQHLRQMWFACRNFHLMVSNKLKYQKQNSIIYTENPSYHYLSNLCVLHEL